PGLAARADLEAPTTVRLDDGGRSGVRGPRLVVPRDDEWRPVERQPQHRRHAHRNDVCLAAELGAALGLGGDRVADQRQAREDCQHGYLRAGETTGYGHCFTPVSSSLLLSSLI